MSNTTMKIQFSNVSKRAQRQIMEAMDEMYYTIANYAGCEAVIASLDILDDEGTRTYSLPLDVIDGIKNRAI